jgi:flagellar biosynthetic protein FlhB
MSEDRTQSPTKLRRRKARERGLVAHSPALTGAAALLAAAVLLGVWGDGLAAALLAFVRAPLSGPAVVSADAAEVVARVRNLALGVAWPLGVVLAGAAAAAVAAHQAQVGGLWAPGLLAPDASRLWAAGRGPGLAVRGSRGGWNLVKALVVVVVAAWAVRSGWPDFRRLAGAEPQALARASGRALRQTALALAAATLALGLVDFALQRRRLEAMLRTTPEEHREDQRSMEGDPALRARRRRLAQAWRGSSTELLAGASLVLTGPAGLTLVLSGGPPPRRVSVRSVARGLSGDRLRRAAASLPQVEAPALALRLARRRAPALPLDAAEIRELSALWPPASPEKPSADRLDVPGDAPVAKPLSRAARLRPGRP